MFATFENVDTSEEVADNAVDSRSIVGNGVVELLAVFVDTKVVGDNVVSSKVVVVGVTAVVVERLIVLRRYMSRNG